MSEAQQVIVVKQGTGMATGIITCILAVLTIIGISSSN